MAVRCVLSAGRLPDTGFYWNPGEVNTFATKDSLFIFTYHLHLTFIRLLNKPIINDQLIQMQRINLPKCNYVLFFHCKMTKTWSPIFFQIGELQRKIGLKVLEAGGNAVIG